jgi:hypothetical protein
MDVITAVQQRYLPEHYAIGYMIAVGKGTENAWERNRVDIQSLVKTDHF